MAGIGYYCDIVHGGPEENILHDIIGQQKNQLKKFLLNNEDCPVTSTVEVPPSMKKCRVSLMPSRESLVCPEGTLVMDLLEDRGVVLSAPCGGRGVCGKCVVTIQGDLSPRTLQEDHLPRSQRLACLTKIAGEAVITVAAAAAGPTFTIPDSCCQGELCLALDIGTTNIKASLVPLNDGKGWPLGSFLNPQRRFGHFVVSRLWAAADGSKARAMAQLLRGEIQSLLVEIGRALPGTRVNRMVFSANTVMTYLLLGLDCSALGRAPYSADHLDFDDAARAMARQQGWSDISVCCIPAASAFLGGDFVGGLTLLDLQGADRRVFFIDMGTNGEMFLRDSEGAVFGASCAMGPALEGMNISCGMAAHEGAIDHVTRDHDGISYSVIGHGAAVGICGTGIIDAIALMLRAGVINRDGSLSGAARAGAPALRGIELDRAAKTIGLTPRVFLSQKDIRAVQLAKGACLAAARMLLEHAGMTENDVRDVYIAGAFGDHLDLDNFRELSFVPDFPAARWHFIGNSSLHAAESMCADGRFAAVARRLRDSTRVVDLASHPRFNDLFMDSLNF
jgi:uncharacterized 2Fe-2S/4Fe-4S cluster protein (DUF4445 family)